MFDAVAPAPTLFPASPELAAPLPADMSALPTEYVFKRVHSVGEVMDAMALTSETTLDIGTIHASSSCH